MLSYFLANRRASLILSSIFLLIFSGMLGWTAQPLFAQSVPPQEPDIPLSIETSEVKPTPPYTRQSEKLAPKSWGNPQPITPYLHPGHPHSAGMVKKPLDQLDTFFEQKIEEQMIPGAVVLIARSGKIVKHDAYGYAARYADDQRTPLANPQPMRPDTIFDLASVTKIFTATAAMILVEEGRLDLDAPVAKYIPEFAANGKETVTVRQLLTHTSGFRPGIPLYQMGNNREERLQIVFQYPLDHAPGSKYVYSDLNMIVMGALVERISGKRLDAFVRERITKPLGMHDTFYNPPAHLKHRIAATEYQPWTGRGMVWGEVHDENAHALDGVAGHAGLFSTAHDLAVFAHMILQKGKYGKKRILQEKTVEWMETNFVPFPGQDHGLGWELNQGWYMDALMGSRTMGHTGYTGTSLVINRDQATITITLTNRVHPTRQTPSINPIRRETARMTADAIPVRIPSHEAAWFSGYGDELNRSLSAPLPPSQKDLRLAFRTWRFLETDRDFAWVEISKDGKIWTGVKKWTGVSDGWETVMLSLPPDTKHIRFRYATDATVNGRGWYILKPVVFADGQAHFLEWSGEGWVKRKY